jgi:hypothetical protein
MKSIIRTAVLCLAAAISFAAQPLRAANDAQNTKEEKVDPIVGHWDPTNTNIPILLDADGSASDRGRKGKWECLTPNVTPRTYRITWERFVDTLLLLKSGNELVGENHEGLGLRWLRVLPASAAAREFDQLTLNHDKALVTAAAPIDRVYQTALEALMGRATQANDLQTAARIKQALDQLAVTPEILGTWDFVNHRDGFKYVAEFKADHTFLWDGKQVGVWYTNGKIITITHYNRGGHSDYFELPVRDGKLHGSNTRGDKVTITRKAQQAS